MIWALVAGTLVFWALRLLVRAPEAPAHAGPVGAAVAAKGDLARLLGAAPVATAAAAALPEASSRFRLLGVMAPKASAKPDAAGQGVALIAVDGKPARAFAVGAQLDTDLVLQAVSLRTASIGPPEGAASVRLEIPLLPAPATGTLPSAPGLSTLSPPPPALLPPPALAIPSVAPPLIVAPLQPTPSAAPLPVAPSGSQPVRRDFGAANR